MATAQGWDKSQCVALKWEVAPGQLDGDPASHRHAAGPWNRGTEHKGRGLGQSPVSSGATGGQEFVRHARDGRQREDPAGGPQAQGHPHGSCCHCGTLPEGVLSPESLARGRSDQPDALLLPTSGLRPLERLPGDVRHRGTSGTGARGVREGCPVVPKLLAQELSPVRGPGALGAPRTLSSMHQHARTQDALVLWAGQPVSAQRRCGTRPRPRSAALWSPGLRPGPGRFAGHSPS